MGLPYTALDLAVLLSLRDLGAREEASLLERIWAEEQGLLEPDLIKSKRTFVLDVAYWSLYLREKPCIDREFPMIQRDAAGYGAQTLFPILGMLKVEGMTTRECEGMIREHLKGYLNEEPNVSVRSNNYKFSVLGEVGRPGTYTSENEKMTIFEALALAGDMTLFSVRDEVKLMREDENGKRTVYELDLTKADVANSPYFYIQQNDVIYVKPTKAKVRTNTFNSNASMWITILSVVTSVTSLVLALTK